MIKALNSHLNINSFHFRKGKHHVHEITAPNEDTIDEEEDRELAC
jgi:hypothetical protein